MKKILALLLSAAMLCSLAACGTEERPTLNNGYPGTWEIHHLTIEGADYMVSELEALDHYGSQTTLVIKDGGKAYIAASGETGMIVDWSETESGIILDDYQAVMEDGLLCLQLDEDEIWCFQKVSDSQLIEKSEEAESEETPMPTESPDPVEEAEAPSPAADQAEALTEEGLRPEFKEAMDAYEAFYDEYCDFMQRYSENPTDMTLIAQYGELMARMVDVDAAFEKWDDSDLNDEELKYYLEVNTRVTQKLIDATG